MKILMRNSRYGIFSAEEPFGSDDVLDIIFVSDTDDITAALSDDPSQAFNSSAYYDFIDEVHKTMKSMQSSGSIKYVNQRGSGQSYYFDFKVVLERSFSDVKTVRISNHIEDRRGYENPSNFRSFIVFDYNTYQQALNSVIAFVRRCVTDEQSRRR